MRRRRLRLKKDLAPFDWHWALLPHPFFRFPFFKDPKSILGYLGTRHVAIFSYDIESFDSKTTRSEEVVKSVMANIEAKGKGIILMHDFNQATAKALPSILDELTAKGFKVVQMVPKSPASTIAKHDTSVAEEVRQKR